MQYIFGQYSLEVIPGPRGACRAVVASGGEPLVYEDRADREQAIQVGASLVAILGGTTPNQVLRHWGFLARNGGRGGGRHG